MPAEFVGDDGASATLVTAATTPTSSNSGGQTAATSTPAKTNTPKTGKNPTATQPKSLGPKTHLKNHSTPDHNGVPKSRRRQGSFLTPVRAERGRRMPQLTRVGVFEEFFKKYPGKRDNRFGYGKAAVDFLGWEIAFHRISRRGSAWWETVNGMMAEGALQTAMRDLKSHRRPQTKAVADWIAYAKAAQTGKGDAERLFWTAHQTSLHEGVAFARARISRHLVRTSASLYSLPCSLWTLLRSETSPATHDRLSPLSPRVIRSSTPPRATMYDLFSSSRSLLRYRGDFRKREILAFGPRDGISSYSTSSLVSDGRLPRADLHVLRRPRDIDAFILAIAP